MVRFEPMTSRTNHYFLTSYELNRFWSWENKMVHGLMANEYVSERVTSKVIIISMVLMW